MDRVRAGVLESAGVELVPEIVFLGDWSGWPWPSSSDERRPASETTGGAAG
jgi:hypothetical protein